MRLSLFSRVAGWAAINNTTKHDYEVDGHPLVKTYVLLASYLLPHAMEKLLGPSGGPHGPPRSQHPIKKRLLKLHITTDAINLTMVRTSNQG